MKIFLCAISAVGLLAVAAKADLKWTETMSMGGMGGAEKAGFSLQSTHYMNAEAGRTDTETKMGPMKMTTREVDLCPKHLSLSFLDDAKLYSETPLAVGASSMPKMPAMGGMMGGAPGMKHGKKTGTQTIAFAMRDLGKEKILDIDTHHVALDSTITSTGCAGTGTAKTSIEVWTADFAMPAPCLATTFDGTVKQAAHVGSDCDVKTTVQGDSAPATKIFNGFIMRMKFGMGKSSFTREVTMLSRAPLTDDVFQVPTDYRKVTPEELEKARQQAMMKSLMGGLGKATAGDGDTPEIPVIPDVPAMPDNN